MIEGLILDIDGVIVGGKGGFNFPIPHPDVIKALQRLNANNILISLCTAKPAFAIKTLVSDIGLQTVHASNGGAEIINHIKNEIIETHVLDIESSLALVRKINDSGIYIEAYSAEGYALEEGKWANLTDINIQILGEKPQIVASLEEYISNHQITKIMPAAYDEKQKEIIIDILRGLPNLQLQWGGNPMYAPTLFGVVTKSGITKQTGAGAISNHTGIDLQNMLGVGDGMSDWDFMQVCGYVATVENADKRLKDLVLNKGDNGYIGGSVDNNGILDILSYFSLLY